MFRLLNSMAVKISLFTLLVAIMPLLGFGWQSLKSMESSLVDQINTHNKAIATRGAYLIGDNFSGFQDKLSLAINTIDLQEAEQEDLEMALASLAPFFPTLKSEAVLDNLGHELIKMDRDRVFSQNELTGRSGEKIIASALNGTSALGEVVISENGTRQIELATPLENFQTGKIDRVMVAEISLRNLLPNVVALQVGKTGSVLVVDRAGRLIAHTDRSLILHSRKIVGNESIERFKAGNVPVPAIYKNHDGVEVLGAAAKVGFPDWLVLVELPTVEALMPLQEEKNSLKIFLGIILVLVIFIIIFTLNRLSRPLKILAESAELIGGGQLDVRVPITSNDEVGKVSEAFNGMAAGLAGMKREKEEEEWFRSGRLGLDEQIRGVETVAELADKVATYLAGYLHFAMGAVFVKKPNGGEEGAVYSCRGGYALDLAAAEMPSFTVGEGLVGQVIRDRKPLLFETTEDYLQLRSGLGEKRPASIFIVPLIYNEQEVIGVMELAFFEEVSEKMKRFLHEYSPALALSFISLMAQEGTVKALEKAQALTEELQTQQEELQVANEELEEQTQKLQSSEEELRVANEELESKSASIEKQSGVVREKNIALENAREILEKKAAELEVTSRYKSEFLANMSHELRTPLNSLLILSQDLAANEKGNLEADQVESATIIQSSGTDLLNLINEILDLSKIEAGKIAVKAAEITLADISAGLSRNFSHLFEDAGLDFRIETEEGMPETVVTDFQRMDQILKNLVSNAVKFTEKGEVKVVFHSPPAGIDLSWSGLERSTSFGVSVIDTGIGIPADKLNEIFEAFQQLDGSTSRQYGGTGLGLSISRELARLLGGEIVVESVVGKGSTFTLYLPLEYRALEAPLQEEASEKIRPESAPVRLSGPSPSIADDRENLKPDDRIILIIEDDLKFAKILADLCHDRQFKFLHAGDGESGLGLLDRFTPDAMILDIKLPGIQGWQVLQTLKSRNNTRHIPVHVMSVEDSTLEAMRMGAIGFVNKPAAREDLNRAFSKIDDMLSGKIRKLLIVEDDQGQTSSIRKLIGSDDVEILAVANGKDALEILKNERVDCMILDLNLPDMTGFELLAELGDMEGFTIPPIIIYTGAEITKAQEEELCRFASSVIIKGVRSPERLLDETALFLHRVIGRMPEHKQMMIAALHDSDTLFASKKILVVDDDMRNVYALTRILTAKGVEVFKAVNGRKALEVLDKIPSIDLVLMDIMMPVMDGYETMGEIRKNEKFRNLPILALTAKAMEEDRQKCIDAGANDYIAKPVDIDRLLSMLRVWLYR